MVSLQSALSPDAKRPPCLPVADSATSTPRKRKRDDGGEVEDDDGIELNFDATPLPLEWQRCLDIKSGQIHYYNTRTHKRTRKDPRGEFECCDVPEEVTNCAPSIDLELNLTFEPRRVQEKRPKPEVKAETEPEPEPDPEPETGASREMVAAVCMRCHMLVMMCRACPACPNCKFVHPPSRGAVTPSPPLESGPPKLALQLLCCKD